MAFLPPAFSARHGKTKILSVLVTVGVITGLVAGITNNVRAAACPGQGTDYGVASSTVAIPEQATYRIWTRMMAPDTTNNTYLLEVDGTNCFNVGGGSIQAASWQWVAHRDGVASSKIDLALTKGNHTVRLIGNKPGVKIDRLVFAADLACTPTGDGKNCDVLVDVTEPTVALTAPTPNATVGGTVPMAASASDNVGVSKVEFYADGALVGTDTTSPYSASWNTATVPNGTHTVGAKAFDAAGKTAQDSYQVSVQNGDTTAPTTPGGVTAIANTYNKITVSWSASTDNTGVKGYAVIRNGIPLANLDAITTYADTAVAANTTYSYQIVAFDAAGNKSASSTAVTVKTPAVADTQPPSAPSNVTAKAINTNQIDVSWNASTDNTGVVAYDVYRSTKGTPAEKVVSVQGTNFGDANLSPNTSYTYYVKARDGGGNVSAASQKVTAKTKQVIKGAVIKGTALSNVTEQSIPYAVVVLEQDSSWRAYVADEDGKYRIRRLAAGEYKLTFFARGFKPKTVTVQVNTDATVIKDVTLRKR